MPNRKGFCENNETLIVGIRSFVRLIGITLLILSAGSVSPTFGLELTLRWQESSETDVKGYMLRYGYSSHDYSNTINAGNTTSWTLKDLEDGRDYFFSVTAYNEYEESEQSEEVCYLPAVHNHPPVAEDMELDVEMDTTCHGVMEGFDGDRNRLEFVLVSAASRGTIEIEDSSTGSFTYTPHPGVTGNDSFVFVVHDGIQSSNAAIVSIAISPKESSLLAGAGQAVQIKSSSSNGSTTEEAVVAAINAGGGDYTDENGVVYQSDAYYSGGNTSLTSDSLERTRSGPLYQSERFGDFSYNIPIRNGEYILTLKFAETFWDASEQRLFDIYVENQKTSGNLDIVGLSGTFTPLDLHIPVSVSDNTLDLSFVSVADHAKLNAILLRSSPQRVVFAVNAGGQRFTASNGINYETDICSGGIAVSQSRPVQATDDDTLYQNSRVGDFSYDMAVAKGEYQVILSFAEMDWNLEGERVFDVFINGEEVESNLDLYAVAGKDIGFDVTHRLAVVDGRLSIAFRSDRGRALVSGILVQAVN